MIITIRCENIKSIAKKELESENDTCLVKQKKCGKQKEKECHVIDHLVHRLILLLLKNEEENSKKI